MRLGLASQQEVGTRERSSNLLRHACRGIRHARDAGEGLHAIEQALSETKTTGLVFWTAELHRRRGELMRYRGEPAKAQLEFRRARRHRQQPESDCAGTARRDESRATLVRRCARARRLPVTASVQQRFTEGFATVDLVEAKALMEAMA